MLNPQTDVQLIGEQLETAGAPPRQRHANETAPLNRKQLMDFIRVNDEFVQLGAPAVLRCRIQSAPLANQLAAAWARTQAAQRPPEGAERRPLAIEWLTSDGHQVSGPEIGKGKCAREPAEEFRLSRQAAAGFFFSFWPCARANGHGASRPGPK